MATEACGDGDLLQSLTIKNIKTGETSNLPVNGLFYAIGELVPVLELLLLTSSQVTNPQLI